MSLGKRLFIGEAAADAACPTDSVQPFGADSAYSSNVALYEFENNANDTVGNHNATSSSNFSTDSKFGTYSFDVTSSSSFDTGISNSELPVSGSWTCSAWVKPTGFSTNRAPISFTSWTTNYGWSLWVSTSGIAYPRVGTSLQGSGFSLTLNNWHHIVLTYDSSVLKFYVDKNLISQHTVTIASPNTNLRFGKSNLIFPTGNFGKLDQVRLYDKALSLNEVEILYNETTSTASDTNVLGEGSGVALYSLDYDASDASGNYDGIPYSVDFGVDGEINWAGDFNSTGYIDTNLTMPSTTTFGFSCWFKQTSAANAHLVGDFTTSATNPRFRVQITSSGGIDVGIGDGSNMTYSQHSAMTNYLNVWKHILVAVNGTSVIVYIDGTTHSSATHTNSLASGSNNLIIGAYAAGTSSYQNFNGLIDQVRFLTRGGYISSQVTTIYTETACVYTPTTDTIDYQGTNIAYYKLDNNALDETTNSYDGTEYNITYDFGRYGTAAVFNGSSSKITSSDSIISGNQARSISAWYKTTTSNKTLIRFGAISANQDWTVNITDASTVDIFGHLSANDESFTSVTPDLLSGNWTHIAVTYDGNTGGTLKLYINGNLEGTINRGAGEVYNTASGMVIGERAGIRNFNGSIDQVRIFDSALDATAVENLYNEKQAYITKDGSDPFGDDSEEAFYKLENNANDSTGSNNGTASNVTFTSGSGLFGTYAADFNGSSSYIDVGLDIHNNSVNGLTYSFWAYWGNSTFGNAISGGSTNGDSGKKSNRQSVVLNKNSERFDYLSREGVYCRHTTSLSDGWHHFAVTDNSAGGTAAVKMYIDGQDVSFSSPTASTGYSTNTDLQIGRGINNSGGWSYFDGSLDQVRIFDRALDGDEVFKLYAEVIN